MLMRGRIVAAMAVGAGVLGFLGWSLVEPTEPLGAVTLFNGDINFADTVICFILAYVVSVLAYLVSFPYGRQIAPLAAPTGLAIWALRTGDMTSLIRVNGTVMERQALYGMFKWEGFFWLLLVAAGFLGVATAAKLIKSKPGPIEAASRHNSKINKALNVVTAVVVTVVIAQFAIGMLAQDVKMSDSRIGSVMGQPGVGQIAFAVLVSFGIAGFVVKKFLDVDYIFIIAASSFVTLFSITIWTRQAVLSHMVQSWPVAFFPRAICAILPIQMVAFGTLGSIGGYWLAAKFIYWRKHSG